MTKSAIPVEQQKELRHKMRKLKIFVKDIKEQFIRSSGKGGQNVNKVSTCVSLHHIPTGIRVKCQEARTQALNRHKARWLLVKKIETKISQEKLKKIQLREKAKRQKRKRPLFLKEEILQRKHKNSEKKQSRKKIKIDKIDQY